jgi:hypothetical protein
MPSMFVDPRAQFLEEVLAHMGNDNLSSISIGEDWLETLAEYGFASIAEFNGFLSDERINWSYSRSRSLLSFSRCDSEDYRSRRELEPPAPMLQPKRSEERGDGRNQSISY